MTHQDFVLESIFSKVLEYFILGAFVDKAKIYFFLLLEYCCKCGCIGKQ